MGGEIGFTLRQSNGEEFRMSRHTNWTPWAIDNVRLAKKQSSHIRAIKKQWLEGLTLPEKKKNIYHHSPYLAPAEYGLVVVDLKKNKILDCNHYHHFAHMNGICLKNEYDSYSFASRDKLLGIKAFTESKDGDAARFYEFHKAGKIKSVTKLNEATSRWEPIDLDINSWPIEDVVEKLINVNIKGKGWYNICNFVLDMSPLEYVSFEESQEGWAEFRQAVLDLGFKLSEKELKIWSDRIRNLGDD
jgi:hypothetical protein